MTLKLKNLLEGFAWERKPGQPLPTLEDVTKIHNEAPIPRGRVDYSTMKLKSNIDQKWTSYRDMMEDLRQWLEVSFDGVPGTEVSRVAKDLRDLGVELLEKSRQDYFSGS